MSITIRKGKTDRGLKAIKQALAPYEAAHPKARIELYRHNPVSVRIRVIDPAFEKLDRSDRHRWVWQHLESLNGEILSDISLLLLLAPSEVRSSMSSADFEDPLPSML